MLEQPGRGGSNEYPQCVSQTKNKKISYTPANSSFSISTWGLRGYSWYGLVILSN